MILETPEGVVLPIKVTPKSSGNKIIGWENEELKIKIAAPPEKGAANTELISFLSKTLHISKSNIEIVYGDTSRHKRVCLKGIRAKQLETLLEGLING